MTKSNLIALCLLISANASAELKSVDFLTRDDGLITHDTVSGLYWLDLNYTSTGYPTNPEMSFSSIQQKTRTPGHPLFGFEHATIEQVKELYTNAGLNITDDSKFHPIAYAETTRYLELTGITINISSPKRQLGYTRTTCAEANTYHFKKCPLLAPYSNKNLIAAVAIRTNTVKDTYTTLAERAVNGSNSIDVNTGHYLVTHYNPTKIVTDRISN